MNGPGLFYIDDPDDSWEWTTYTAYYDAPTNTWFVQQTTGTHPTVLPPEAYPTMQALIARMNQIAAIDAWMVDW